MPVGICLRDSRGVQNTRQTDGHSNDRQTDENPNQNAPAHTNGPPEQCLITYAALRYKLAYILYLLNLLETIAF